MFADYLTAQPAPGPDGLSGDDHRPVVNVAADPEEARPVTVDRKRTGEIGRVHRHQGMSLKGVPARSSRSPGAVLTGFDQSRFTPSHSTTDFAR